ncbi:MAG TPA: glycine dehydrogenase, partial [Candidatus Syntrophosphaera sp.]|nr:glycine dehydrogenase [Candidatus Syntrophosphaera sp.]
GPLFGFFATHKDMARLMPGRIVGATVDVEGRRAYTLTLQAREQHIRREKATSNICSNESLCVLAATVYLSLLGREGLTEVAIQSTQKAHFLANKIASIPGFSLCYPESSFFKEFAIHCPVPAQKVIQDMLNKHIFAGVDLKPYGYDENTLLIAVTEKKTRAELEAYANALREMKYE